MPHKSNFKKFSFLIYGLGSTGLSVIQYFKKRKVQDFYVWDDNLQLRKKLASKVQKKQTKVILFHSGKKIIHLIVK